MQELWGMIPGCLVPVCAWWSRWVNTRAIPLLPWYPTLLLLLPCISEESFESKKSSLPEARELFSIHNLEPLLELTGEFLDLRITRGIPPSQQGGPSLLRQSKSWCLQCMFFLLIYWLISHDCVHPSAMDFKPEEESHPLVSSLFMWLSIQTCFKLEEVWGVGNYIIFPWVGIHSREQPWLFSAGTAQRGLALATRPVKSELAVCKLESWKESLILKHNKLQHTFMKDLCLSQEKKEFGDLCPHEGCW